ncbi:MAG: DUF4271 domain-containing protein [Flavobacteriales bacterium]|nr:DUF4271 domain-containing protein [Flavobacteriales bacterium]
MSKRLLAVLFIIGLQHSAVFSKDDIEPVLRNNNAQLWVFVVSILILIIIGIIKLTQPTRHILALRSGFLTPENEYEFLTRENGVSLVFLLQVLLSCLILGLSVYMFLPFDHTFTFGHPATGFGLAVVFLLMVYSIKYFIHYIVGIVLQTEHLGSLMLFSFGNLMYAYTIAVFPLVVVWYFVPDQSIKSIIRMVFIGAFVLFLMWRLAKSILIYGQMFPFSKIYLFLYLCTLEIVPLLLLGKILVQTG